jgi:hypothetical protein
MKKKSLIETNPYLKDPAQRKMLVERSVRTSCGVEGIKAPKKPVNIPITRSKDKNLYKRAAKLTGRVAS